MTDNGKARSTEAGARNLAEWNAKHPGESNLKHGTRSRHVRRRFSDLRTRQGKDLARIIGDLEADLGPLTPGQRVILENVRAKLAITRAIASWCELQPSVVVDGKLLPILGENFVTYTGAIQRGILALYELAGKRPHRTVDLESYIAGKKAAKGNGGGE